MLEKLTYFLLYNAIKYNFEQNTRELLIFLTNYFLLYKVCKTYKKNISGSIKY